MFLKKKPVKEICKHLIEKLEIKTMGMEYPVKMMSGGNIQKVLLGREMMRQVDYFIVAYPVRGLDVAASHTVYNMLDEIKQKGVPILFIGEDLDHLLAFSDRIMVMCQGKVTGIVEASETTKEAIGEMMAGHTRGNEEEAMSHVG